MTSNRQLLNTRVASAFYGRFLELRPAQEAAVKPIITGSNVVVSASTGSGKTEAVIAPLLSRHWETAAETDGLTILYIAPTKALVNDLEKRLDLPLQSLGLRVGVRHGDRDDLARGVNPHLLITTPESLDVMMFRKDASLKTIKAVVIDEVHLLYNTQRGLHLSILIERLRQQYGDFQWAALSATVGKLSDVRDFLFRRTEPAEFIQYPANRIIDAQIRHVRDEAAFHDLVARLVTGYKVKLLVFANSRRECERLAGALDIDDRLRPFIFAHYSSLSPELRLETETRFSNAETAVCIATSTLELGIDIGDIDAVVLWGVPSGVESFLQRIGRGNRRKGKSNVLCLVPDTATGVLGDSLRFLAILDAARKGELPIRAPFELYGAVAQQCLSVIASDNGSFKRVAELSRLGEHKDYMDRPKTEEILAELGSSNYIQHHGFKNQYGADEKLYALQDYRMIYGNFSAGSQTVEVRHSSKVLGTVPAINLLRIERGSIVRFAGKLWQVRRGFADGIQVEPAPARNSTVEFAYPGSGPSFDPFLTDRIWHLLQVDQFPYEVLTPSLRSSMTTFRQECSDSFIQGHIPYVELPDGYCYFTFAGRLVNRAVCLITHQSRFVAKDVTLISSTRIDWRSIPTAPHDYEEVFPQLFEPSVKQSIYQSLLPLSFQLTEFLQDWLKDGSVVRILERLSRSETRQLSQGISGLLEGEFGN